MSEEIIAVGFTLKQRIEIERIVIDEDKESALEFVKKLNEELKRREEAHCKVVFRPLSYHV